MQAAIIVSWVLAFLSACRGGLLNFDRKSRGPARQAQLKLRRCFLGCDWKGDWDWDWDWNCDWVWDAFVGRAKVVRHAEWPEDN